HAAVLLSIETENVLADGIAGRPRPGVGSSADDSAPAMALAAACVLRLAGASSVGVFRRRLRDVESTTAPVAAQDGLFSHDVRSANRVSRRLRCPVAAIPTLARRGPH